MTGAKILETRAALYEMEIPIEAPRERVWQALTEEINAWWLPDFHMTGEGSVVTFDAVAGGQLYERHESGKTLLWCTVHMCEPGVSIYMVGHTSPDWGGPATSMLKFQLEDKDDGTVLRISDALFGHVSDETVNSLQGGWRWLMTDGLKAHVEAGAGAG